MRIWLSLESLTGGSRLIHVLDPQWSPEGPIEIPCGCAGTNADTWELLSLTNGHGKKRAYFIDGPPIGVESDVIVRYREVFSEREYKASHMADIVSSAAVTEGAIERMRMATNSRTAHVFLTQCGTMKLHQQPDGIMPIQSMNVDVPVPGFMIQPFRKFVLMKKTQEFGWTLNYYVEGMTTAGMRYEVADRVSSSRGRRL